MSKVRILVVDDERLIRLTLEQGLANRGYAVLTADRAEDALRIVRESPPDLVLLDIKLPDRDGSEILPEIRRLAPQTQVVMLTACESAEMAIQAFKDGAADFVTKPFDLENLEVVLRRVADKQRLQQDLEHFTRTEQRRYDMSRIIGKSPAIRELLELTGRIARSDASTVLLTGESGTGKDLVARAIHYGSPRRDRPFMAINCTAISENLLESELMGHERGAFTDAKVQKKGLFEMADGGTVFLDEIGDMQRSLQVKLLRTIEERTIRRVGGTETLQVDIRIIAATNRNLERAVREGDFRDDLYYRLKVFPLHLPPLRERLEDVREIAIAFVEHFNRHYRRKVPGLTEEALVALEGYDWPGNVRELRNVIERAVILQTSGELGVDDLPLEIRQGREMAPASTGDETPFGLPAEGVALEAVERDLIRQALERTNRNQTQAARLLHLSRDALRYRMKKFDLR
jgi:two-component system response regulator AtoC